jgi:hypothetical protein
VQVVLNIDICSKRGGEPYKVLSKQHETNLIPEPGIAIEDAAWGDAKVPKTLTQSFAGDVYLLYFDPVVLNTEKDCKREVEMYLHHGWE